MQLRILLFSLLLLAGGFAARRSVLAPEPLPVVASDCPGTRPRLLFGLLPRPLTLLEMVNQLERGCLALDDVRFRAGQDTIELYSPAQFAMVARALGMAQGAYRVAVRPEASPGWPPDTVQARRRGMRLRDELLHYGASMSRLVEDPGWPSSMDVVAPGAAKPMLVRVPDPQEAARLPLPLRPPNSGVKDPL